MQSHVSFQETGRERSDTQTSNGEGDMKTNLKTVCEGCGDRTIGKERRCRGELEDAGNGFSLEPLQGRSTALMALHFSH